MHSGPCAKAEILKFPGQPKNLRGSPSVPEMQILLQKWKMSQDSLQALGSGHGLSLPGLGLAQSATSSTDYSG